MTDVAQRFWYVRNVRWPQIVADVHPSTKILQRPLHNIKRAGVAWLYRGLYVGVIRTGTGWVDTHKMNPREVQYWRWLAWTPRGGCYKSDPLQEPDQAQSAYETRRQAPTNLHLVRIWQLAYNLDKPLSGIAPDGIPWVIHGISDDATRDEATRAFHENLIT